MKMVSSTSIKVTIIMRMAKNGSSFMSMITSHSLTGVMSIVSMEEISVLDSQEDKKNLPALAKTKLFLSSITIRDRHGKDPMEK